MAAAVMRSRAVNVQAKASKGKTQAKVRLYV
jgi:hypothetical protein